MTLVERLAEKIGAFYPGDSETALQAAHEIEAMLVNDGVIDWHAAPKWAADG